MTTNNQAGLSGALVENFGWRESQKKDKVMSVQRRCNFLEVLMSHGMSYQHQSLLINKGLYTDLGLHSWPESKLISFFLLPLGFR